MGVIVKSKKHLYIRVPILLLLIGVFAISPILIGMIGAWITEFMTGQSCHEGNCFWGAFGWLFMFTFPIAGVVLMAFFIIVIIDIIKLFQK